MGGYSFFFRLCFAVLLCVLSGDAVGPDKPPSAVVRVTGAAYIVDGDVDTAFQEARKAAFRKAVKRVTSQMLQSGQLEPLRELLGKHIYGQPGEFVLSSKMIRKEKNDTYVNVTLKVEISPQKVMKRLEKVKELAAEMRKAPVGLIIHETRLGEEVASSECRAAIAEVLTANNFRIKEASIGESETRSLVLSPSPSGIVSLGEQLGVEILIVGRVKAEEVSFEPFAKLFPECKAELELKAYDARNGELFIDLNEQAQDVSKGGSLQDAARAACRKAGRIATPKFVRQLYLKWINATVARPSIRLVLQETTYAEWQDFKKLLDESDVDVGVFHWAPYDGENQVASAEVDFRSDISVLARRLSIGDFKDKLNIEPLKIGRDRIILRINRKPRPLKPAVEILKGENRWAVLIGIGKYNPPIPPLKYTVNDVEALNKMLSTPGPGHFNRIKMLTDNTHEKPSRDNILSALEWLQQAGVDDTVLIYYSGHGVEVGKSYILPSTTQLDALEETAIDNELFLDLTDQIRARRMIVMLDCCHSGGLYYTKDLVLRPTGRGSDLEAQGRNETPNFKLSDRYYEIFRRAKGRVTLVSCAADQVSYEWVQSKHSVFTYYLLEGLKGPADVNGDRIITFNELAGYVEINVQEWSDQFAPSPQVPERYVAGLTGEIAVAWKAP